jgi:gliding motility-associated peptidyl-prolyl isomerase
LKQSVIRNKKILAAEEKLIKSIIEKDSINTYHESANRYWYYYDVKDSLETYTPQENDIVLMTYNIRNLNNDTIYSFKDMGDIHFKIDKENYFPGLRTGIKLLKKGETATFFFPSSIAYGFYGDKNKIGTNEPLISTIKLIDILEISKDSLSN